MWQDKETKYVGRVVTDNTAQAKVTGKLEYGVDIQSVSMLHLKLKPSTISHGIIRSISCEEAWKIPGVRAIYTFENTPKRKFDRGCRNPTEEFTYQERIFEQHIRFYGERVAGVVAETPEAAMLACDKIQVEYEELPVAATMEQALQPGAALLHNDGKSIMVMPVVDYGDYDSCQGDYTFFNQTHVSRMTHLTMENHSARAVYNTATEKMTIWSACQSVFGVRQVIARFLNLPYSKVQVRKAAMGGSFGARQETFVDVLAAYAAWDLGADVKLSYSREEQINNAYLKHNFDSSMESKVLRDGTIVGMSIHVDLDAGAYQTVSPRYARTIGGKLGKGYRAPNVQYSTRSICTNSPVNGGFRSWGTSECYMIMENHWNMVARKLGMDPIDFRIKNVLKAYEPSPTTPISLGNTHYIQALETGRKAFGWEWRKAACKQKNDKRYRYGVGMAFASHGSSIYPDRAYPTTVTCRVQEDGSLILRASVHDHGCGTVLAIKKVAAEVMQVDLDKVEMTESDTETGMYDCGDFGSRQVYVIGRAMQICCQRLLKLAKEMAAQYFNSSRALVQYREGLFFPEPEPGRTISLSQLAAWSMYTRKVDLYEVYTWHDPDSAYTAAVYLTEVRVDTYTGMTEVMYCLSVHDVGKTINPDMCMGQVGSGIQQGIGVALCEEIKIHPKTGRALITNLKNYEVANICEMPDYDAIFLENGDGGGAFGAKALGEVSFAPVAPAIVAAVNDALGTELTSLPLTPAVILEALAEGARE